MPGPHVVLEIGRIIYEAGFPHCFKKLQLSNKRIVTLHRITHHLIRLARRKRRRQRKTCAAIVYSPEVTMPNPRIEPLKKVLAIDPNDEVAWFGLGKPTWKTETSKKPPRRYANASR